MKTILLYPPQSNARTPYLSLPTLSSYLRTLGETVIIRDLNLDLFYDSLPEIAIKEEWPDADRAKPGFGAPPRIDQAKSLLLGRENTRDIHRKKAKQQLQRADEKLFEKHNENMGRHFIGEIISLAFEAEEERVNSFYRGDLLPWLQKERADLIGISIAFPNQLSPSLRLARFIKRNLPGIHIVLGGTQITKFASDLSSFPELFKFVDSMVTFEGERPLKALLKALKNKEDLSRGPNLIYLEKGCVNRNPTIDPEPINNLPTPDFQDLSLDRYLLGDLMLPIITSRGCYWGKCSFCTYREIHKRALELRDISLVVEDIKLLSEKHQCRYFRIVDDALSPKRCGDLSTEILKTGINIRWRCMARMEKAFTGNLCNLMAKAGCNQVLFGLESCSQRVLNLMNKGIRVDDVKSILKHFKEAGIKTHLSFMIGFPTETREEADKTKQFIVENKDLYSTKYVQTFILEAGTELDRTPEKFGITKVFRNNKIGHGTRYGYQFETKSGLFRDEAEEITKELQDI